jgi:arylsulfatase A
MFPNRKPTAGSRDSLSLSHLLQSAAMLCGLALGLSQSPSSILAADVADQPGRPNIVLIVADDLGWSDLGCYGADLIETPHLDRLARQGIRFTSAYAASSVCTPTRAALMTGKHPARLGMTIWAEAAEEPPPAARLVPPRAEHNLPLNEVTLAEYLRDSGYRTALVGKWHLGDALHYPETQGFDVNIGGTLWGAPHTFFYPYRGTGRFGAEYRYVPHLEFGQPGEYLTDRLTDEALHVIDRADGKPFFLYLAHHAPHTPIEAPGDDVTYFERKLSGELHHRNPAYAAMVRCLDQSVGRVLERLEARGLAKNTIVVFTSDNGGYVGREKGFDGTVTDNSPLRSGKGALYEGGIRVPLMLRGPNVASGESAEPVRTEDLFFTLLAAAGVRPDAALPADGVDLGNLLKSPSSHLDRQAMYFHYPHYYHTTSPVSAVRAGDWKLLEFFEDRRVELYNLADDLGEKHNLAEEQPQRARALQAQLAGWREAVGARLPVANPNYVPPKKNKKK